ncbi:MAG: NfeD family protein [Syntrophomonadaceae bacterium]|nr:NfeD family protein [Syntrophomonadaceae bacterium]
MTWQLWLALALILVIAELFSLTFYLILFALGAVVAAAAQAVGLGLGFQLSAFATISLVLTVYLQPILKRTFVIHQGRTSNVEALVGQKGYVTEAVADDRGLVKIDREVWSARSGDGQVIPPGTPVEVARIEGVKLIVNKISRGGE